MVNMLIGFSVITYTLLVYFLTGVRNSSSVCQPSFSNVLKPVLPQGLPSSADGLLFFSIGLYFATQQIYLQIYLQISIHKERKPREANKSYVKDYLLRYLVSCFSAGVGRAGTFCVIYSAIRELSGTGNIGKDTTMLNNSYLLSFVTVFQCFPNWHFHTRDCQLFKVVGVTLCYLHLSPTLRQVIMLFFIFHFSERS